MKIEEMEIQKEIMKKAWEEREKEKKTIKALVDGVADGSSDFKSGKVYKSHVIDAKDVEWKNASGILDWEKFQVMKNIGTEENIPYDTMIMHPFAYVCLTQTDEFKSSNVWQVLNSKQKDFCGLHITVTPWIDKDKVLFYNADRYKVIKVGKVYGVGNSNAAALLYNLKYMGAKLPYDPFKVPLTTEIETQPIIEQYGGTEQSKKRRLRKIIKRIVSLMKELGN